MAKTGYKIPENLNKTPFDTLINLKSDGLGLKPVPLYILLCWVASLMFGIYVVNSTFVKSSGLFGIFLFVITYAVFCSNLFRRDSSGLMQMSLVTTIPDYVPRGKKTINTRDITKNVYEFYTFLGIEDIDEDTGVIYFIDGTYGVMYRVVGNASTFLFDKDRDSILDRYRNFVANISASVELTFFTAKEPQQITHQVGNVYKRYKNLEYDDPELKGLLDQQFNCLKNEIGGSYRSIHQYLLIRADNNEELIMGINNLRREVETSTLVFRQCEALDGDGVCEVISHVFSNKGGLNG